ncbi:MAG TPA: acyl-CoA dehydrogenase C-terminal domain-containing protein [Magnetospirillaceae bacterium]|nr:acyl-CoA dehydrogenase C-terminal domain-containing protein [Magnetospirillaceae bacterium]
MPAYTAPLRDMRFVLYELHKGEEVSSLPGFEEMTPDLIDAVMEEAAKLSTEVLQPLNASGDLEGCHFENGVVRTPKGFKEAYDTFKEGGWTGIACDPNYGGQGLPTSVNMLIEEMISSANLSFGMYPGLTHGAYKAIHAHGTDELKAIYLPKMVDGTWGGTMNLTEPHCGTDLGLMRTKAVPQEDGSYKITGTKIFISSGEHDLTENIIHLVLAKIPGGPKGIKGISLFVVPKFLVKEDGSLGARNGAACGAIEHKMGIHANSTCVMNYDDATGWLIGEEHKGMRAMFTMMNAARQGVAVQGLGVAEAAYQGAVAYAKERLQGRSLSGTKYPDKPADPLLVHPDIRRMLLTMRANIEGARALGAWVSKALDLSEKHPDAQVRQDNEDLVAILTPILKACFTDLGFETANLGVQIFGGHGYIRDHGMEQLVRDARITQIYEGANGIQALDLVGRKLGKDGGRALMAFFNEVQTYLKERAGSSEMNVYLKPLGASLAHLQQASMWFMQNAMGKPDNVGAGSYDYMHLFGLVALGYMWCRIVEAVIAKLPKANGSTPRYSAKLVTARFFMERMLPETAAHLARIQSGAASTMDMPEDQF